MQRVLFAWEHGGNFGHIARLGALADAVSAAGYVPVWALPASHRDRPAFARRPAERFAAPRLPPVQLREPAASFGDILLSSGFGNAAALQGVVRQWLRLFEASRAEAIVLDCAPTAQLAAHIAGIAALQLSNGFDAPPADCPLFGWGRRGLMVERAHRERLAGLERSIAQAAMQFGVRANLESLLAHPTLALDCVEETDPYGPRPGACRVGPLGAPPATQASDWPQAAERAPRVFVYLREGELLRPTLQALRARGANVLCVCPDAGTDLLGSPAPGLAVVRDPVPIERVLKEADAVVGYGSTTMVCQALLAGRPQMMLPTDVEKWLVSRRAAACGAGVVVRAASQLGNAVEEVLSPSLRQGARLLAAKYAQTPWRARLHDALAAIGLHTA